jgi:hypothetical protein
MHLEFPLPFVIIFLRTCHFFEFSAVSSLPHQKMRAEQIPQQGACGVELSRMMTVSSNLPPAET